MDLGRSAYMGAPVDDDMGVQPDSRLDRRLLPDKALCPDLHVIGKLGSRRDDRGGVDTGHVFSRTIAAKTASATTLPPTVAVP